MKRLIITLIVLTTFINTVNAQSKAEQFRALKVGFLTETLDLTADQAEKFWPIYNKHQEKIYELRFKDTKKLRAKLKENKNIESISDSDAQDILNQFMEIDSQILIEQKTMYSELKSVLSAQKILRLHQAEHDFNKKMLRQLREHKKGK